MPLFSVHPDAININYSYVSEKLNFMVITGKHVMVSAEFFQYLPCQNAIFQYSKTQRVSKSENNDTRKNCTHFSQNTLLFYQHYNAGINLSNLITFLQRHYFSSHS